MTVVMERSKYPILIHNHRRMERNQIPGFNIESRFSSFLKQVKWPARQPSAPCQGFSRNPAVLGDDWNNRIWRFFDFDACFSNTRNWQAFQFPFSPPPPPPNTRGLSGSVWYWIFLKYSEPTVIKSTQYPPNTGWNRHETTFSSEFPGTCLLNCLQDLWMLYGINK